MDRDQHFPIQAPPELCPSKPSSSMASVGEGIFASTLDSEIRDPVTNQGLTLPPKIQTCDSWLDIAWSPVPDDLQALLAQFDLEAIANQGREHSWVHNLIVHDDQEEESAVLKRRRLAGDRPQAPELPLAKDPVAEIESPDALFRQTTMSQGVPSVTPLQRRRDSGYGTSVSDIAEHRLRQESRTIPTSVRGQSMNYYAAAGTPTTQTIVESSRTSPVLDNFFAGTPKIEPNSDSDSDEGYRTQWPDVRQESFMQVNNPSPSTFWNPDIPIPSIEKFPSTQNPKKRKIAVWPAWMRELSSRLKCPRCGTKCKGCLDEEMRKYGPFLGYESVGPEELSRNFATSSSDYISRSISQNFQTRQQTLQSNQPPTLKLPDTHNMEILRSLAGCFPVTALLATVGHYQQHQIAQLIGEGLGYFKTTSAFTDLEIPAPLQKSLDALYNKYQNDESFRPVMVKYLVKKLQDINAAKEPTLVQTRSPKNIAHSMGLGLMTEIDQLTSLDDAKALLRKTGAKLKDHGIEIEMLPTPSISREAYNEKCAEVHELEQKLLTLQEELRRRTEKSKEEEDGLKADLEAAFDDAEWQSKESEEDHYARLEADLEAAFDEAELRQSKESDEGQEEEDDDHASLWSEGT